MGGATRSYRSATFPRMLACFSGWGCWFGARYYDGDRRILADDAGNLAAYSWLRDTALTYGVENLSNFIDGFGVSQWPKPPFWAAPRPWSSRARG